MIETTCRRLRSIAGLTCLAVAMLSARPLHANLLANASFEAGPVPEGGELFVPPGSTVISGWVAGDAGIDYISDVYWVAANGSRSIALNPLTMGSISQTVATVPGARYDLDFAMSGEPFTLPVIKRVRVSAAGQSTDLSFDSTPAWHWDMFWSRRTWSFIANSTSTTLTFRSLDDTEWSPVIDDVVLTQATTGVPPSTPRFAFAPPAPNPARGNSVLAFTLPAGAVTRLEVLDAQGRVVSRLMNTFREAGSHRVRWDALDERGEPLQAGIYFVSLTSGGHSSRHRVALIR